MIISESIDNDYTKILEVKIESYKMVSDDIYKDIINIDTLLNIGKYIDELKPKSKYRDYKYKILEFIDILENNHNLSKKEVVILVQGHLSDIFIFLESKHSFIGRHDWFWRSVFNLALDLLLILIGVAKYYFYLPIFTITAVIRNVIKLNRAKKEGRYIDF
jgi:hypothetical protein